MDNFEIFQRIGVEEMEREVGGYRLYQVTIIARLVKNVVKTLIIKL